MSKSVATLPEGWREVKLGEICSDISYGHTATAQTNPVGPKFLRITDIVTNKINWDNVPYCKIENQKKQKYKLKIGDIVIARTGATTGYSKCIQLDVDAVFASYLIRYRLQKEIANPDFIEHVLQTESWNRFVEKIKARSAQPGGNATEFAGFKIFLPTLPEQKSIASLLETWDTAIEKTEALIAAKEKRFKWLLKTLIGDQGNNPNWKTTTLGEIGEFSSAGVNKKIVKGEQKVRLVNYLDVYRRNKIYSHELNHQVTAPVKKVQKCSVKKGDVFFTPSSEVPNDIGNSAVAMEDIPDAVYSYHIVRLRPRIKIDLLYCAYAFKSIGFYKQAVKFAQGSGQRYVISKNDFQKIRIALPSLREQAQIASILDNYQQETTLLHQVCNQFRIQKRGLMQNLLTGKWLI